MLVIFSQVAVIILGICILFELIFLPRVLKKVSQNSQGGGLPWYKNNLILQQFSLLIGSIGSLLFIASIGNLIFGRTFFFFLDLFLWVVTFIIIQNENIFNAKELIMYYNVSRIVEGK